MFRYDSYYFYIYFYQRGSPRIAHPTVFLRLLCRYPPSSQKPVSQHRLYRPFQEPHLRRWCQGHRSSPSPVPFPTHTSQVNRHQGELGLQDMEPSRGCWELRGSWELRWSPRRRGDGGSSRWKWYWDTKGRAGGGSGGTGRGGGCGSKGCARIRHSCDRNGPQVSPTPTLFWFWCCLRSLELVVCMVEGREGCILGGS